MTLFPNPALLASLASAALPLASSAQWTVVNLHPPGAAYSACWDVEGGQQIGHIISDTFRASLWSGSAASRIDLMPAGGTYSTVRRTELGGTKIRPRD